MKISSGWIKFALLAIGAIITGNVVEKVVTKNLYANVYPAEADSISIPIMSAYLTFIILIPFASIIAFVNLRKFDASEKYARVRFWLKTFSYFLSYIFVSLVLLSFIFYWYRPHHKEILLAYSCLLVLVQLIVIYDLIYCGIDYFKRRNLA